MTRSSPLRLYFRCPLCLSTVALDAPAEAPPCPVCGDYQSVAADDWPASAGEPPPFGPMEPFGSVPVPPPDADPAAEGCDAHCRVARGPSCDCVCGGANHGADLTLERVGGLVSPDGRGRAELLKLRTAVWLGRRAGLLQRVDAVMARGAGAQDRASYVALQGLRVEAEKLRSGCGPASWSARDRLAARLESLLSPYDSAS